MIYTIGIKKSYDQYIDDYINGISEDIPKKLGKTEEYQGGSVWETLEDVKKYLFDTKQIEFGIYGVLANWETDTEINEGLSWRNLIKTSPILKLE